MVHALQALREAWRVLKRDGVVCDIHPISSFLPVEVVKGNARIPVGVVDLVNSPSDSLDRAIETSEVLGAACNEGRFAVEKRELFNVQYYWDSIDGLLANFGDVVSKVQLMDSMIDRIAKTMGEAGTDSHIILHRTKVIGRYRKVGV